jgi:hypothetical protein
MLENARHERKFILPQPEFVNCDAFVRSIPLGFKQVYVTRQVNNIYFDTHNLDCLIDTIDGEANRFKLRARWYGTFFGKADIQMEVKSKINVLGYKSIYNLGQLEIGPSNLYSKSAVDFCALNVPPTIGTNYANFKSTLANSYRREYYLSACKTLRLTIDKEIKALPLRYRSFSPNLTRIKQNVTVIEVKFAPDAFETFRVLANHLPIRFTRFSKYEIGMHQDLTLKIKNIV